MNEPAETEPEEVAEPAPSSNGNGQTVDARAWLEEKIRDDKVNLCIVADAIGMTGFTPDDGDGMGNRKHVQNWLNSSECKDLRDAGLKVDYRANVSKKGAMTIFDRATAREEVK